MKKIWIIVLLLLMMTGCKKTEDISMIVPYGSTQLAQLHMQNNDAYHVDIVQGADPLVAAFGSGSHDVIFAPTNLGAKMYQSKQTYQLLATIVWGNFYFITERTDIHTIQDLDQEDIIVFGQNQTSDFIVQYILDQLNIDCQISYVDSIVTASSMFIADTSQIVLVAEPSYANLKHIYPFLQSIDIQQAYEDVTGRPSFPQASVFIKDSLSQTLIDQITYDLSLSIDTINSNPEEAAQLANTLNMDIASNVLIDSISSGYIEYMPAMDAKTDITVYFEMILNYQPELIGGQLPIDAFYRGD